MTGFLAGSHDILTYMPMPALGLLFTLGMQSIARHIGLSDVADRAVDVHDDVKKAFGITVEEVS